MINSRLLLLGSIFCAGLLAIHVFSVQGKQRQTQQYTMILVSNDFEEGQRLPDALTCNGENASPHLAWDNFPAKTKSFALMCNDPDAPKGNWVHWVMYNIPATVTQLSSKIQPVPSSRYQQCWENWISRRLPPSWRHSSSLCLYHLCA